MLSRAAATRVDAGVLANLVTTAVGVDRGCLLAAVIRLFVGGLVRGCIRVLDVAAMALHLYGFPHKPARLLLRLVQSPEAL